MLADIYCQLGLLQDADKLAEKSLTLFHDESRVHIRRETVYRLYCLLAISKACLMIPFLSQSLLQRVLAISRANSYPLERSMGLCFYMNALLNEQGGKSSQNIEQLQAELLETVTGTKSRYVLYIYQGFLYRNCV